MTPLPALAALLALAAPTPKPCVTPAEMEAVMIVAMPGIVTGTAERCAAKLPADAFLRTEAEELAERYRREGEPSWPAARGVVRRFAGEALAGFGDAGQRAAVDGLVGTAIAERLSDENCATADQLLELIAPLPTSSIGTVSTLVFALVADDERTTERLPFRLCEPTR